MELGVSFESVPCGQLLLSGHHGWFERCAASTGDRRGRRCSMDDRCHRVEAEAKCCPAAVLDRRRGAYSGTRKRVDARFENGAYRGYRPGNIHRRRAARPAMTPISPDSPRPTDVDEETLSQSNKLLWPATVSAFMDMLDGLHAATPADLSIISSVGASRVCGTRPARTPTGMKSVAQIMNGNGLMFRSRGQHRHGHRKRRLRSLHRPQAWHRRCRRGRNLGSRRTYSRSILRRRLKAKWR